MSPDRVLLAPDKFKGSLTALEVARAIDTGIRSVAPATDTVLRPIADGGDGTLAALAQAGWDSVPCTVSGPLPGSTVVSGFVHRGTRAVIELADPVGLHRLLPDRLEPMNTTTVGVGELIAAAMDHGCRDIVVGLGGSASTDGGLGLLRGLGAVPRDESGAELPPTGASLNSLADLDMAALDPRLRATRITIATDVDNPLYGTDGAAEVFATQKGADAGQVAELDAGLRRLAAVLHRSTGREVSAVSGAGAAGGTAAAVIAVLGSPIVSGADFLFDLIDIDRELARCAFAITGEGKLDAQSVRGKAPVRLARRAHGFGVPTTAVVGHSTATVSELAEAGFAELFTLTDIQPDIRSAMRDAAPLLREVGRTIGHRISAGTSPRAARRVPGRSTNESPLAP